MSMTEDVAGLIVGLRGQRVLLDADLARLYGVTVKSLKQSVRRNRARFPPDFLLELTPQEARALRSQRVTLDTTAGPRRNRRGQHSKFAPFAFTEQGVAMLASVLRSERAVQVNIAIMRAFVHMRRVLATHADLARKIDELERVSARHDSRIRDIFSVLRQLLSEAGPEADRPVIGFKPPE